MKKGAQPFHCEGGRLFLFLLQHSQDVYRVA